MKTMTRLAGAILLLAALTAGCATDNGVRIAYYTGPNGEPVPVLELPGVQCPTMLGGSGPIQAESRGCAQVEPIRVIFYERGNEATRKHEVEHIAGLEHGPWRQESDSSCAIVLAGGLTDWKSGDTICRNAFGGEHYRR